ncbi:MAG: peptide deformylase [Victivallaceae bacterium]|nr:peptide deformylase [Victivallaceae bacterium]
MGLFSGGKSYSVKLYGSGVLSRPALPVPLVDKEVRLLASEMLRLMRKFDGIGLAAPQVGKLLRLIVLEIPEPEEYTSKGEELLLPRMPLTLVNPVIVGSSRETATREEGCLSVPEIFAPVTRPAVVELCATTLDGETITCECGGLLGRCLQHEIDHLDGKLFVDRLTRDASKEIAGELSALERTAMRNHYNRR